MILDNFESWLDEDDNYLNQEIAVFLNTLFNSDCRIRAIFVSQILPHSERAFFKKVTEIEGIDKKLEKGLDKESALKLVRNEGRRDIFGNVRDEELFEFFRKVYYIPQAIQSMMDFLDDEAISFDEFQTEFWEDFKKAENDPNKIDDDTPKELRPTGALLSRQILRSDQPRQYLLSLLAFFESVVPKDLLHDDSNEYDLRELRRALDRLVKNKLVTTEIDSLAELNEQTGRKTDIVYYSLHGFIKEIIREVLSKFEEKHPTILEKIAGRIATESRAAWEKKLFEKQLALAECWEKIEAYFVINLQRNDREDFLAYAEFQKALALQETAFSANLKMSLVEISERVRNADKLYLKFLVRFPNGAVTYYNLGNLLAKDEKRLKEAEEKYNKAIELNPNYADAYINLGILLAGNEERRDDADKNLRRAIKATPKNANTYFNLAAFKAIYGSEADKDEIFECMGKCVNLDSSFMETVKGFAEIDWIRDDPRFAEIVDGDTE